MRFYNIVISGGPAGLNGPFTSYVNGTTDLGALNVEFDIPASYFSQPMGFASVRIWGVSLQTIGQASDFNGSKIKVYGGMSKGLPLANPAQQGLLIQGTIFQAFGNWIGVDQTLDFVIATDGSTIDPNTNTTADVNLTFYWTAGDPIEKAIKEALATGYPNTQVTTSVMPNITMTQDQYGIYKGLEDFSNYISNVSKSIIKTKDYLGVQITMTPTGILVSDCTQSTSTTTSPNNSSSSSQSTSSSSSSGPKTLAFPDLIGQPTWIGPSQVQFNTAMRADINMFDQIKFPPLQATSTAAEFGQQAKDHSSFQGTFNITMIRHVGNFRVPNAQSWITTFNAIVSPTGTSS